MKSPLPLEITIRRSTPEDAAAFRACLDVVARERRWIGFLQAPPLDEVTRFLTVTRPIQFLAEGRGRVVGWCDVTPDSREGFRHGGTLGMGVLPEYRGMGIGRALLERAVAEALERGLTRIELEVFGSNEAAVALYEGVGFQVEGRKRHARKLDGDWDDVLIMALLESEEG